MLINSLEIKNFRNISHIDFKPDAEVNIIYGENAQGKTNILEAIWLFSGLKSFRGAKDAELLRFGTEKAFLKCGFEDSSRSHKAELTVHKRRAAKLNGVSLTSPAELMGKFSAVVFAPSFMSLIKDGPSERRKFIDAAVCQLKPNYAPVLAEYTRLVKQRNALLKEIKNGEGDISLLDVIDESISVSGEKVLKERTAYLELLSPAVSEIYDGLSSGKEKISLEYQKKDGGSGKSISEILKENRRFDIINLSTSAGPHRDDIDIKINGISARSYGSQGQQRSCAVALKLGEAAVTENEKKEKPVILLDDVMSELDTMRQDYILNHIKERQVFITCCEPSAITRLCGGKTFNIRNGELL